MWAEASLIICFHCRLSSFQLTHSAWGLQSYLKEGRQRGGGSVSLHSLHPDLTWGHDPWWWDESGEGASTCHHHLPLDPSYHHLNSQKVEDSSLSAASSFFRWFFTARAEIFCWLAEQQNGSIQFLRFLWSQNARKSSLNIIMIEFLTVGQTKQDI